MVPHCSILTWILLDFSCSYWISIAIEVGQTKSDRIVFETGCYSLQ